MCGKSSNSGQKGGQFYSLLRGMGFIDRATASWASLLLLLSAPQDGLEP